MFKTIGGFDPEYFMYVEDADLTQRALRQGLVYLLPQFTATHAWHRDPMRDAGKFKMQLKAWAGISKMGHRQGECVNGLLFQQKHLHLLRPQECILCAPAPLLRHLPNLALDAHGVNRYNRNVHEVLRSW